MVSAFGSVTILEDIAKGFSMADCRLPIESRDGAFGNVAKGKRRMENSQGAQRKSSTETSGGQPYLMGRITVPSPRVT
jgi:hypothetical protein